MSSDTKSLDPPVAPRRTFLSTASLWTMAGGLVAGYGGLIAMALRYLYPTRQNQLGWRFVTTVRDLAIGESIDFTAPSGATVVVARKGKQPKAASFIALSNVCPHLGCHVHWEDQNKRFFCPCHNGTFDATGKATGGPPAMAKQHLRDFAVKVVNGLLFVEVPLEAVGKTPVAQRPVQLERQSTRRA